MMSDLDHHHALRDRGRRLPWVWIVPAIALLAAAWLGVRALAEQGPRVEIAMQNAEGIEVGKTKIKHRNVELGVVEAMRPSPDLKTVTVEAQMNRYARSHLVTGTRFWIVRPRFSAAGISGLNTLISGAYIEMEPGVGAPARRFRALEDPPVVSADVPGTTFTLRARRLGFALQGAPVTFHGVKVGEVLGYGVSDEDGASTVTVFVRAPHDRLVHEGTRFWNASGVSVDMAGDGVRLHAESVETILAGGVAFDVPPGGEPGPRAKPQETFALYADEGEAHDALFTRKIPFLMHVVGSAQGLSIGSPVRMRGIYVGEVTDVHMEYDAATRTMSVPVTFAVEPQRVVIRNGQPIDADFDAHSYAAFDDFVRRGLRARLASSNLVTGQKMISLDFVPEAGKTGLLRGGRYPEIPSVGSSDVDAVIQSTNELLVSLKGTTDALHQIVTAPSTKRSLESLDRALANVDRLTHDASLQTGPLLESLRKTSASADQTLAEARRTLTITNDAIDGEGAQGGDLGRTLKELEQAARSLHALTDYLESHPGALIRGKHEETKQ